MIGDVARDLQLTVGQRVLMTKANGEAEEVVDQDRTKETTLGTIPARDPDLQENVQSQNSLIDLAPINGLAVAHAAETIAPIPHSQNVACETRMVTETASEIVPSQVFEAMIDALTKAMGPMARWIVHDHIGAMGESIKGFPKKRLDQLVERTSGEILTDKLKARFRFLMSKEIDRIERLEVKK
jgi:hypothetical protein